MNQQNASDLPHGGLDCLISGALQQLQSLGYHPETQAGYRKTWGAFKRFVNQESEADKLSTTLVQRFLETRGIFTDKPEKQLSPYRRHIQSAMHLLNGFALHGCIQRSNYVTEKMALPPGMQIILAGYEKFCMQFKGNRPRTVYEKRQNLTKFIHHLDSLGVKSIAEIQASMVTDFVHSQAHLKPVTLATLASHLHLFLCYLCMQGLISGNVVEQVPKVRFRKDDRLPSVWRSADVSALLAAVDRSSPVGKRDYAILQLVVTLGMRVGDIRTLRLEHLRWDESRIEMTQTKTGAPLSVPLTEDVGKALIEYLRDGRPKSHHREVFLRANAPFEPFCANNNLYHMITTYRRRAGIGLPSEKRRGMHSLRYTVASRLLEAGTPLETISAVMGHLSSETTLSYTKMDIEALRRVAIDLEEESHA